MTAPVFSHVNDRPLVAELDREGVLRITLDRPARRNALGETMLAELQTALDAANTDPAVRVVVIAANGPAFSAGHDLKELTAHRGDSDGGRAYFATVMANCSRLMMSIVALTKPVIAEVEGIATAAGCQIVASCDLAIAAHTARFATPGVDIGLFCSTPAVALSRNIGVKAAMEMLLTGDGIDSTRALEIGLVNRVVPADRLREQTTALAREIASKSPLTLAIGKAAFYAQAGMSLQDAYARASAVMIENLLTRDADEGISAFLERREPSWEGR